MIYEKSTLNPKEDFGESTFACPFCDKVCRSKDQCKRPLHRDTVKIPEATILGIVIGTDCPSNFLNPILKLLEETRYKHVKIYWATLHPAEYRMNYLEVDASAIKAYQDDHSERIGRAKNHFTYTKDGGTMPPYGAQKRINFYPVRKEALPEEPPSELA